MYSTGSCPVALEGVAAVRVPPLGSIAKSPSIALERDAAGGDDGQADRRDSVVARRFALQRVASEILPRERVARCCRRIRPGASGVDIWYDAEHNRAHYGGLETCSSIWHCPVCAAKISERRRQEVASAVETWAGRGGLVLLVTLTLSHHMGENLDTVLKRLDDARKSLQSGRAAVKFKAAFGVAGSIRAIEITHGESGWHPHLHILYFVTAGADVALFTSTLKADWSRVVAAAGGLATLAHGCDVQTADTEIVDYITKLADDWNVTHEVTKSNSKQGRISGRSPLQLLADAASGDQLARRLWLQYAIVMKGRRFLFWSRGLRDLLALTEEQTDEQIAEEQTESATKVCHLPVTAWAYVVGNDARAELLAVARSGFGAVCAFLTLLGVPLASLPYLPLDSLSDFDRRE